MKKSELYHLAMRSVINDPMHSADTKLKIIEQLMADKSLAVFSEKKEEDDF